MKKSYQTGTDLFHVGLDLLDGVFLVLLAGLLDICGSRDGLLGRGGLGSSGGSDRHYKWSIWREGGRDEDEDERMEGWKHDEK